MTGTGVFQKHFSDQEIFDLKNTIVAIIGRKFEEDYNFNEMIKIAIYLRDFYRPDIVARRMALGIDNLTPGGLDFEKIALNNGHRYFASISQKYKPLQAPISPPASTPRPCN